MLIKTRLTFFPEVRIRRGPLKSIVDAYTIEHPNVVISEQPAFAPITNNITKSITQTMQTIDGNLLVPLNFLL